MAPSADAAPVAPHSEPAAAGEAFDHERWLACFERLGLGGLTRNLAAHCVVEQDDGQRLLLRLAPSQEAMAAEIHVRRVQEALAGFGVVRKVVIEVGPLPDQVETPRQQAERLAAEQHACAIEALQSDPHVRKLQDAFGARLIESSVKPVAADAARA